MAVTDFNNRRQIAAQTAGFSNFSNSMDKVGQSALAFQNRDIARQQNQRANDLNGRQERQLVLNENRQAANLAEEARKRKIAEDIKQGISNADKQRIGFSDQATIELNKAYEDINKEREMALSTIGGGTTYDASGNVIQTPEAVSIDNNTRNAIESVNKEYNRRINIANNTATELYNQSGVDSKAYGNNVYNNVIKAGGSIDAAAKARQNVLTQNNLNDIQNSDIKRIENNLKTDLDRIALGKKTVQEGVSAKNGKTSSGKTYKGGEFLSDSPAKNQFDTVDKLKDRFPNDLFTTSWLGSLEADDMAKTVSDASNLYIKVDGKKRYPSTDMILNAALESTEQAGLLTDKSVEKDKFFKVMERKLKDSVNNIKEQNRGNGGHESITYNANALEQEHNIKKAQERYNRDILAITGGQNKDITPADIQSKFSRLFNTEEPVKKTTRKVVNKSTTSSKQNKGNKSTKEIKHVDNERLKKLESKYGNATKGTSKAKTKIDKIRISKQRSELKDIGLAIKDINEKISSKRLKPKRRSQLEKELTKLKSKRDILNK